MKKLSVLFALVAVGLLATGPVATAAEFTIGLKPVDEMLLNSEGQIEILVDTVFDVELYFSGLDNYDFGNDTTGQPIGLVGMNLGVQWDPLVQFDSFGKGSSWPTLDIDPATGPIVPAEIKINGFNFGSPIDADHTIGVFTLTCVGEGLTELTPFAVVPGASFSLSDFSSIDDQVGFEAVTINQVVPIPSALLLLGGGLIGLLGIRRKFKE